MSNIRSSIRVIAAAAFACAAPAISQVQGQGGAASPSTSTTTSFERHVTKLGDHEIIIEMRDGEIVTATLNGEPIPAENIKQLGDGAVHIDQPGDAPDMWFNVRAGRKEGAVNGGGGSGATSQIVVVGPHGEPMTVEIPGWITQADAGPRFVQRGFTFHSTEDADQPPPKVMIGVQMAVPGPELAGHLGLDPAETTLIAGVYADLPAAAAGLEKYDVIVAVDGERPAGSEAVREALADAEPGDTLTLTVVHRGEQRDVVITLAPWDEKALSQRLPGAVDDKAVAEAFRPGAGAWAGDNGATTFMVPALRERAAALALHGEADQVAARLKKVEAQLQRVEEMLSRLVEQEQAPEAPPAPAPPGPPALPHDGFDRWEPRA